MQHDGLPLSWTGPRAMKNIVEKQLAYLRSFLHDKLVSRARSNGCVVPVQVPPYQRADLEEMFLPIKQMLQIERVIEISKEGLVCEMDVSHHWVFPFHFPSDPIFPGTFLIEAAGQAVAIWAWNAGFRGRPRLGKVSAKFLAPVLPEHRIVTIVARVHHRNSVFNGMVECFVAGQKMAEIEPVLIIISEPADVRAPLAVTNGH